MFLENHLNSTMNTPSSTPTRDTHHQAMALFVVHSRTESNGVSLTNPLWYPVWVYSKRGWDWCPSLGILNITKNKYFLDMILPIVGWCGKLGHLPTPVKNSRFSMVFNTSCQSDPFCCRPLSPCLFVRSSESSSKPLGQRPRSLEAPGHGFFGTHGGAKPNNTWRWPGMKNLRYPDKIW